ncbi:MAG: hypothetical protein LLG42_03415 [Chloroflexi bacterium]|nr:hypothetical protein [Chloroflexota bacterium]
MIGQAVNKVDDRFYHSNFILMSGCDIPPGTPAENVKAFYAVIRRM